MRVTCDHDELAAVELGQLGRRALGDRRTSLSRHRGPEPLARELRQTARGHSHLRNELDDEWRRAVEPPVTVDLQRAARAPHGRPHGRRRGVAAQMSAAASDRSARRSTSRSSGSRPERTAPTSASRTRTTGLVEQVMAEAERVGAGEDRAHGALLHSDACR